MTATYYDALGVSPVADTVVITAAYRAMMRKHHPDLNRDPARSHGQVRHRRLRGSL
jgi:curved DNA-binding protein